MSEFARVILDKCNSAIGRFRVLLFQRESKCEAFVTDIGFIRIERGIDYWNNLRTETFFEKEYEGNSEMLYSWFSLT